MRLQSLTLILLAACTTLPALARERRADAPAAATETEPEKPFPIDVNWQLIELNGKGVSDGLSIRVDDTSHSSGFGGCNNFSAVLYQIRGQRLAMGPIALTKKSCDPAHAALERTFLGTLHSGPTWDVVAGDLVVKLGPNTLRFRRGI